MGIRKLPPIRAVLGVVDDRAALPARGDVGDAWWDEGAGLLWI